MVRKSLLFVTNVPSPYRVCFFNELSKYFNLTVIYEKKLSDERDKKWTFQSSGGYEEIFLNGIKVSADQSLSPSILKYLKNNSYDFIIISNFCTPTGIIAAKFCIRKKIPYCVEGDGAFLKNKENYLKKSIKKKIISNAVLCFSSCDNLDKYFIYYGSRKEKVVRYPFTSICEKDILYHKNESNKSDIKNILNINETNVVISIGQFIYRKGFDLLIKSANMLDKNIGIYIIGGKPTDEYINLIKESNITNIHFVEFKNKDELENYFKVADISILPTREDIWGLVINESLAHGIPVITSKFTNAGLELIKNGFNGFIMDNLSVDSIVSSIKKLLSCDLGYMYENCIKSIDDYTIENMALVHYKILKDYIN